MIIFMRTTETWSPTNGITHITGSAFRYNHLNLPSEVSFTDGNIAKYASFQRSGDAAGIKLRKEIIKVMNMFVLKLNTMLMTLMVFLMSCTDEGRTSNYAEKGTLTPDTTVSAKVNVVITDSLIVQWDLEKSDIVIDSTILSIRNDFARYKQALLIAIKDDSKTTIINCYDESFLSKGDLSIFVIDKVISLPYASLFQSQFDAFALNCSYPSGLVYNFRQDRIKTFELIKTYCAKLENEEI